MKDIIKQIIKYEHVRQKFLEKFPNSNYEEVVDKYLNLPEFKVSENIHELNYEINDEIRII